MALADIHGEAAVVRALADALTFEAFSSEYIAHLIQARGRQFGADGLFQVISQRYERGSTVITTNRALSGRKPSTTIVP